MIWWTPVAILIGRSCRGMLQHNWKGLMGKRYRMNLSANEGTHLLALSRAGMLSARKLTRAHILLQADAAAMEAPIAAALHVGIATVERVRRSSVEGASNHLPVC
jgi:hypothetical protein